MSRLSIKFKNSTMAVNPVPNDIPRQPKIINEFMLSQKNRTNKI
jgi:hypothetical protein